MDSLYASIEGFWQGLKFDAAKDRARIAQLHGAAAKFAARGLPEPASVAYRGVMAPFGRPEHWA